eukprot:194946-Lingulodinium_polyedra.AAC.1
MVWVTYSAPKLDILHFGSVHYGLPGQHSDLDICLWLKGNKFPYPPEHLPSFAAAKFGLSGDM